jgi:tRNA nucleotidyltransferase (CCA-adding enzyme)
LLKVIQPNLHFTEELEATLKSMQETLSWFNLLFLEEKTDKGILYLMALLSGLKDEEMQAAAERLSPSPKVRDMIMKGITRARNMLRKFPLDDPVGSYNLLSPLSIEMVLFLMALSRDRKKQRVISHYLTELRRMKTILKGDDLQKMGIQPGPVYSKILTELLAEKLKGRLKTREDEEKLVRTLIQV